MSGPAAGSVQRLWVPGHSAVHRLAPAPKVAGLVAFVVLVAVTPRWWVAVLALDAVVVAAAVAVARLPPRLVLARLGAVVPFVAFAVVLPFVGTGEQVEVAGVALSVDGLWAAWNIVAKAAIGGSAAIVVSATTPIAELLAGLHRLRVPAVLVAIVGSMVRYLDVVADDLSRMRRAMTARGHDPRWLWQAKPIAASVGTLFVRTYERGERVHHAMVARGFDGTVPPPVVAARRAPVPALAAFVPAAAAALSLLAAVVTT